MLRQDVFVPWSRRAGLGANARQMFQEKESKEKDDPPTHAHVRRAVLLLSSVICVPLGDAE